MWDVHDVPVIKNASVVKDETDHIIGVVETITDVSELDEARRRAMDAAFRLKEVHRLDDIVDKSDAMQRVFQAIKAASTPNETPQIDQSAFAGLARCMPMEQSRAGAPGRPQPHIDLTT